MTSPRFEGPSLIEAEIAQERALALGRLGRDVETALSRLKAVEVEAPERARFVAAAAEATWSFFVQREACGLYDHAQVIADYAIPREVLARVGARQSRMGSDRSDLNPESGSAL